MNTQVLNKLADRIDLSKEEVMEAIDSIMEGACSEAQIASFLTAIKMKGETVEEISACALSIRNKAKKFNYTHEHLVDCCGTGGDHSNTFNISTTAAFIAAGAGVKVAKHGNRSITSKSGGADVLEQLGINIVLEEHQIIESLNLANIGFLFAPSFHHSFKHAANVRKQLGFSTVFNLLGPMVHPAFVKKQIMGVYDQALVSLCAQVLQELGTQRAMVIHGLDGMDEITLTGKTSVAEVNNGQIAYYEIDPEYYGMKRCQPSELTGGTPEENAVILTRILEGAKGPQRDIAVLNAAAAIYISGIAPDFQEGIERAIDAIEKGYAREKLKLMKVISKES